MTFDVLELPIHLCSSKAQQTSNQPPASEQPPTSNQLPASNESPANSQPSANDMPAADQVVNKDNAVVDHPPASDPNSTNDQSPAGLVGSPADDHPQPADDKQATDNQTPATDPSKAVDIPATDVQPACDLLPVVSDTPVVELAAGSLPAEDATETAVNQGSGDNVSVIPADTTIRESPSNIGSADNKLPDTSNEVQSSDIGATNNAVHTPVDSDPPSVGSHSEVNNYEERRGAKVNRTAENRSTGEQAVESPAGIVESGGRSGEDSQTSQESSQIYGQIEQDERAKMPVKKKGNQATKKNVTKATKPEDIPGRGQESHGNEPPPEDDIPLPKGAYNLDFLDDLDNVNPFQTKSKIASSPPAGGAIDPFKSSSKMANSPPKGAPEDFNPFKPRSRVPRSPARDSETGGNQESENRPGESESTVVESESGALADEDDEPWPDPPPEVTFQTPARPKPDSENQQTENQLPPPEIQEQVGESTADPLEELRQLDEEENWRERTSVITKEDHTAYEEVAKEVVQEIVEELPIKSPAKNPEDTIPPEDRPIKPAAATPAKGDETFEDEFVDAEESLGQSQEQPPPPPPEEPLEPSGGELPLPPGEKEGNDAVVAPTAVEAEELKKDKNTLIADAVNEITPKAAEQVKEEIKEQVKEEVKEEIKEQVKEEVKEVAEVPKEAVSAAHNAASVEAPVAEAKTINQQEVAPEPKLEIAPETEATPAAMETENEAPPSSPPLPARGSYNFDFDTYDENINPFVSGSKLGSSPPQNLNGDLSMANPFQSKSKMAHSPPGSPKVVRANTQDNSQPESPVDNSQNSTSNETSTTTTSSPAVKTPAKKTPKKKEGPASSTKKATPKRPKFRPPSIAKKDDGDDEIQIFAPGTNNNKKEVVNEEDIQIMLPPSKGEKEALETEKGISNSQESAMSISDSGPATDKAKVSEVKQEEPSSKPEQTEVAEGVPSSQEPAAEAEMPGEDDFQPASSEMFNDSAAWDMLNKFGEEGDDFKSSALARQSLYVKFDPLIKGQSPAGQKTKGQAPNSIPTSIQSEGDDLLLMSTPPQRNAEPKTQKNSVSKVKNTPKSTAAEVDRLFNDSLSNSHEAKSEGMQSSGKSAEMEDTTDGIIQVLKYSQSDVNRMMKELIMEHKVQTAKQQEELEKSRKSITCLEQMIKDMRMQEEAIVEALQKAKEMGWFRNPADRDTATSASHKSMQALLQERDLAYEDLKSVEDAFANLHQRYEKNKQVLVEHRKNEEVLKKCILDYQDKLKMQEERYEQLKKESEQKLQMANTEIEKQRKSSESQVTVIQAAMRKAEIKISSLESILEQKTKENKELTAICDELFAKVGDS